MTGSAEFRVSGIKFVDIYKYAKILYHGHLGMKIPKKKINTNVFVTKVDALAKASVDHCRLKPPNKMKLTLTVPFAGC